MLACEEVIWLKLKYIIDDISRILVDYYIDTLNKNDVSVTRKCKMQFHMKQAIVDTYTYLYNPIDDIWSISIWDHGNIITYELNHDLDYDRIQMNNIINEIQKQFNHIIHDPPYGFSYDVELISFNCVPFDGFGVSTRDIISLLDIDSM